MYFVKKGFHSNNLTIQHYAVTIITFFPPVSSLTNSQIKNRRTFGGFLYIFDLCNYLKVYTNNTAEGGQLSLGDRLYFCREPPNPWNLYFSNPAYLVVTISSQLSAIRYLNNVREYCWYAPLHPPSVIKSLMDCGPCCPCRNCLITSDAFSLTSSMRDSLL
jgi:hypothetical protein